MIIFTVPECRCCFYRIYNEDEEMKQYRRYLEEEPVPNCNRYICLRDGRDMRRFINNDLINKSSKEAE